MSAKQPQGQRIEAPSAATSSSHYAAESSEAAEGEPEARVPIPAPSEGDAMEADEADEAGEPEGEPEA